MQTYHCTYLISLQYLCLHNYNNSKYFFKNKINNLILKNSIYPAKKTRSRVIESFIKGVINKKSNLFIADTKSVYDIMDVCFAAEESMLRKKRIKIKYSL